MSASAPSAAGPRSRRTRPNAALGPLAAVAVSLLAAAPAAADLADDVFAAGLEPVAETDLATLRGGFRIGGYDITLGAVVKTIVGGASGQMFELISTFNVPDIGVLTHLGTTITPAAGGEAMATLAGAVTPAAPAAEPTALPSATGQQPAPLPTARAPDPAAPLTGASLPPGSTLIALPGTTILSQGLFNTFIENMAVDRVITLQTDLNLMISGLATQATRLTAAKLARHSADAQVQFLGR